MAAPPARVWDAILAADVGASPVSTLLLCLRGYGRRAWKASSGTLPERLERFGFTKLKENPGHELVFGLAGQFWRPSGGLRPLADEAAFAAFAEEGCVKAAWNIRVAGTDGVSTEVSTETRIACYGEAARRKFGLYWAVVGPFSGVLRKSLLRAIRRKAEAPTADRTSS
ncbi:MAG TPA: hypothetical protein VGG65_00860 [Thermoanaerobaculia bacterium]